MGFLNNLLERQRSFSFTCILFLAVGLMPLSPVYSQNTTMSPQPHRGYRDTDTSMTISQQLVELRGNVARLEATLEQDHRGSVPLVNTQMEMGPVGCGEGGCGPPSSGMKTGKMNGMEQSGMGSMGKMGMGSQRMGMGSGPDMPPMELENRGMRDRMKMRRGAMPRSALPGFPGASHLYHIGETDFFLNHQEHITLAPQQELTINQIKEHALLTQASFDRQVEQAEQELWVLTSSDEPETRQIEEKVRHIEKLKGDQRLAFIRAVGEAAKVLTEQQRQALIGTGLPQAKAQGAEQK